MKHIEHNLKRDESIQYLLFCDLDGFTAINKSYGRQIGDSVLEQVEIIIRRHFNTYLTYRLIGDQFVVVLNRISEIEALNLAEACRQTIKTLNGPG
jgi:diguanylate cyclase (GGDEF)-like protein